MNKCIAKYKKTILYAMIIMIALIIVIAIGFPLGFITNDPDGLERVLIDSKGEYWLEKLKVFWYPILSWIENEYIAGIIGILLTLALVIGLFNLIKFLRNRKTTADIIPVSE